MTDTPWLDEDEQRAWRAFLLAARRVFHEIDTQLQRDARMPHAYYEVLVRLSEAPDHTLRMSELADRSLSSRSRLSHAVARLETSGLIRRAECPTDRRGTYATLTDKGRAALSDAAPGHAEQVRRVLFDPLTRGQVDQLRELCEAVADSTAPPGPAGQEQGALADG